MRNRYATSQNAQIFTEASARAPLSRGGFKAAETRQTALKPRAYFLGQAFEGVGDK
jgi:hypothetical protein